MTGVSAALDLAGTLDLALTLQPGTKQVFVVSGVSEFDRFYERLARQQLQRFAGRVTLTYLSDLPLAELEQTVAHLPPDSIIYFLTLGEDGAGARFRSTDALDRLSAVANAPIYGWNGVAIGHGIVGGRLYSNDVVAERSAELALRILRGEKPDSIPVARRRSVRHPARLASAAAVGHQRSARTRGCDDPVSRTESLGSLQGVHRRRRWR